MSLFETAVPAMQRVAQFAYREFSPGNPEIQKHGGATYAELTPLRGSECILDVNTRELIVSNLQRNVSKEINLLYGSKYEVTAAVKIVDMTWKGPQLELTVSIYEPGRRP